MWKNCLKKGEGDEDNENINPQIDYTLDSFYACKFDCCHYAVHEECYGGTREQEEVTETAEEKKETNEEVKEEEKVALPESYLVQDGRHRTPYDVVRVEK